MRLERLIGEITDYVRQKITENQVVSAEEVENTARLIAMAALKYGDLSNQPTKDYVFDLERFAAFEGNTGPYILYTIVRIKSILHKYSAGRGAGGYAAGRNQGGQGSDAGLDAPERQSPRGIYGQCPQCHLRLYL